MVFVGLASASFGFAPPQPNQSAAGAVREAASRNCPEPSRRPRMTADPARSALSYFDLSRLAPGPAAKCRSGCPIRRLKPRIAAFDAILARNERFVLIFHGAEMRRIPRAS